MSQALNSRSRAYAQALARKVQFELITCVWAIDAAQRVGCAICRGRCAAHLCVAIECPAFHPNPSKLIDALGHLSTEPLVRSSACSEIMRPSLASYRL